MTNIWKYDTSDMTLEELQEYKKELQRQDNLAHQRRARNIRLAIYAAVLLLLIGVIVSLPGFVRYPKGPVVLVPQTENLKVWDDDSDGYAKRTSDHTVALFFPVSEWNRHIEGYREIDATICQEPELLNVKGKSTATFNDGSTGTVRYDRQPSKGIYYLEVEYQGQTYGFRWCSIHDYREHRK